MTCRAVSGPYRPPDLAHVPLPVIFLDDAIAVVDKPPDLLTCPGTSTPGWDSVLTRAQRLFPGATGSLLVHRLDQATSGLLVLALTPEAHLQLSGDFAARRVEKDYVAVLDGELAMSGGEISLPLRLDYPRRPLQIVDPAAGKPAQTSWRRLEVGCGRSLVLFQPRTGRTHQLRVHAADPRGLGAPIVGDRLYGTDGPRLLLHASRLAFSHPLTGLLLGFDSAPRSDTFRTP